MGVSVVVARRGQSASVVYRRLHLRRRADRLSKRRQRWLRDFAEFFFAIAPDLKVELSSRLEAERWAVGEWKMSGTQQGDMPNLPATHKPFSIRGVSILELQDGKIRRCTDYWDMSAFLKQLR
jgi:steroid delta-isomerase-like uncharacterized protein